MSFNDFSNKTANTATRAKEGATDLANKAKKKASEIDVDKLKTQAGDLADSAIKAAQNVDIDDLKERGAKLVDKAKGAAKKAVS